MIYCAAKDEKPGQPQRTKSQGIRILCGLCALCGELNNDNQPPSLLRLSRRPLSPSLSQGAHPALLPPALVVWGLAGAFR